MTESELFSRRNGELEELIRSHVERGSLDEGNAAIFDPIIEAWLAEELVRLRGEIDEAIKAEMAADSEFRKAERLERHARRQAAESAERASERVRLEVTARLEMERIAEEAREQARRQREREAQCRDRERQRRKSSIQAQRGASVARLEAERRQEINVNLQRHDLRVSLANHRLDLATQHLDLAVELMLGTPRAPANTAPVLNPEAVSADLDEPGPASEKTIPAIDDDHDGERTS